jgi:predicted dehydrogenase
MAPRIGLIGCGRWGRLILRDLLACRAEVHVVVPSEETQARASVLGAASTVTAIAALPPMDGYIVASPTITHAAIIAELLPTGRPIFTEKPMTADVVSARRLAAEAGDRLFVMDKWRYHPGVEAMRQEIAAGHAGEVLSIRMTRWGWGNPHDDVSALWILAPHDLSILQHLIGTIPPLRFAVAAIKAKPDLGFTVHLGTAEGPTVSLDIGIASPEHRRRCLIIGSRATLELRDGYDQSIFVREGAPGDPAAIERSIAVGSAMPLLSEIERFLAFLGGGPAPMSSAEEGLAVVERLAEIEAALGAPA